MTMKPIVGYGVHPGDVQVVVDGHERWLPIADVSGFLRNKKAKDVTANDPVEHPQHYTRGTVELIELIGDLPFSVGNAIKYIYRAGYKDPDKEVEDLHKARFYLNRLISDAEIRRLEMEESHGG